MKPKVSYYLSYDSDVVRVYEILSVKNGNVDPEREYTIEMKFLAILSTNGCRLMDELVHPTNGDLEDLEKGNQDPDGFISKKYSWKQKIVPIVFKYFE